MKAVPPVLAQPDLRKRYDEQHVLYPWEHPEAYWLRASLYQMVCTRCGARLFDEECPRDPCEAVIAPAFVAKHLQCALGCGLDAEPEAHDPLFEEAPDAPKPLPPPAVPDPE